VRKDKQLEVITHNELSDRFSNLAYQINSLLAQDKELQHLSPGVEIAATLSTGTKINYQIRSKRQPVPLKMHVVLLRGSGNSMVFLSDRLQRPSSEKCDKEASISNKDNYINYSGNKDTGREFMNEFIFFTIEARQDIEISIQCIYGNAQFNLKKQRLLHPEAKEDPTKRPMTAKASEISDTDDNFFSDGGMWASHRKIKKHHYLRVKSPVNYEERRIRVLQAKEVIEDLDIQRKFLLVHRREINKQHVLPNFKITTNRRRF